MILVDSSVRIEILTGASRRDRPRLRRVLSALPLLVPSEASWGTAEKWVETAAGKGARFGVVDLLIGVLASEAKAAVWSLDADFERMKALGLIETHRP